MGLFDKKYCDICGEKIGLFGNKKLADGNMCGDCQKKLSRWFSERRESTVDQIKEQLSYRQQNEEMLRQFQPTKKIGQLSDKFILIDEKMGHFVILREGEDMKKNPDLFELSRVRDVTMEIRENRTEVKRKDANGNSVSFDPPHYSYRYNFIMTMIYDSPYFPEVRFALSNSSVDGGKDHDEYRGETVGTAQGFGGKLLNSIGAGIGAGMAANGVKPHVVHSTSGGGTRGLPGGYRLDGLTTMTLHEQQKYRELEYLGNEVIAVLTGGMTPAEETKEMISLAKTVAQAVMSGGIQSPTQAQEAAAQLAAAQEQAMAQARQDSAAPSGSWVCSCGSTNTGRFCIECGAAKP